MKTLESALPYAARTLFALIFLAAAPRHFTAEGISHAADLGVPFAGLFGPLSGIIAIAGGVSLITGYRVRWGAWALIVFLVPVTLGMHQFWTIDDPVQRHIQVSMFMKNLSMIGGALFLAGYARPVRTVLGAGTEPAQMFGRDAKVGGEIAAAHARVDRA